MQLLVLRPRPVSGLSWRVLNFVEIRTSLGLKWLTVGSSALLYIVWKLRSLEFGVSGMPRTPCEALCLLGPLSFGHSGDRRSEVNTMCGLL